jgi:heptosyltransferase-2
MATPAVREIRECFPGSRITLLAHWRVESFWSAFPGIDRVITSEPNGIRSFMELVSHLRLGNFDAALTFPASFSSAFLFYMARIPVRMGFSAQGRDFLLTHSFNHERDRQIHLVWDYLELVRQAFQLTPRSKSYSLETELDKEAVKKAAQLLGGSSSKGYIALGPGATYGPAKRWPLENWKELMALFLSQREESLVILGTKDERESLKPLLEGWSREYSERVLNLAGETDLSLLAAVLSKARLLLTNDSGPMHLAVAAGTPVVAIFGSTSPLWTGPFGNGHIVVSKNMECSPCFQKTCPIGYPCLRGITAKEVYEEIHRKLTLQEPVTGWMAPEGVGI